MNIIYRTIAAALATATAAGASAGVFNVRTDNVKVTRSDGYAYVNVDFNLDSLRLKGNQQVFLTPVIRGGADTAFVALPSILVSGRNVHYAYERGSMKDFEAIRSHDILREVMRKNGRPQTEKYSRRIPLTDWMRLGGSVIEFVYDSCACGIEGAPRIQPGIPVLPNPADEMVPVMVTPVVTDLPMEIHEGRARVQFEVDRTVLHDSIYICRNGQRLDNRAQLRMIDDSVRYALSDPNVEIAHIAICGYASPESPYLHNEELATNRSRALAEYLADRYHLPRENTSYSSVPENWAEFREQVVESDELTERQRLDLLELIDRPTYGPSDFDAKEKELKTSPKFAKLYRSKILPEWFPKLRATTFAISTRLRPMSDEKLAEVFEKTPEKMSLNQMFRVARLHPEGSEKYNEIIKKALFHYPDSETANLNAAAAEVKSGNYDIARRLLLKAGECPEVWNLRGIIATSEGDFEEAERWFDKAGTLPEAKRNKMKIEN